MTFQLADIVKRRRDLKEDFEREQKELAARYVPKIETLDAYLLKYLIDNKQKTVATDYGTVLTYKRRNIKMTDLEALQTWATFNKREEFVKSNVDSTEVLAYLDSDDKHQLPDGLKMDSTDVLSVKAPK